MAIPAEHKQAVIDWLTGTDAPEMLQEPGIEVCDVCNGHGHTLSERAPPVHAQTGAQDQAPVPRLHFADPVANRHHRSHAIAAEDVRQRWFGRILALSQIAVGGI